MRLPLNELGAAEAARGIASNEFSARELVTACLDQIVRYDSSIHAWINVDRDIALAYADAADATIAGGGNAGPLAGVPVGIKDIFNTTDFATQMGSPIWKDFTPGNDARVVHYLRMAGAIVPGKTVTAEFAVHAPGPTENPHRRDHIPGTSSSGSAAAVAAYMVPVSLGTQTAGSIIRPASYCGIYGFKPSFGLVPRTGMLKTTDSLDTVGWFARNVEDLALIFETIRVKGADYPIGEAALNDSVRQSAPVTRPWRIALIRGPKWSDAEGYVREAVQGFAASLSRESAISVEEVETPAELAEAHQVHATIYDKALAYYFKEEFQQHTLVSSQIYEIIERGNGISLEQYQEALQHQRQIAASIEQLFVRGYDAVIDMATASAAVPGLDSVDRPDHALIWTLCGVPAVSVPVAKSPDGLPLGVQLVSRRFNDRLLLELLNFLEQRGQVPSRTNPEPPMAASQRSLHPDDLAQVAQ
jgi:Asp-tRNA(Asn)/Glu-tRNA(Gln) amidotransferase A subunit family amidase